MKMARPNDSPDLTAAPNHLEQRQFPQAAQSSRALVHHRLRGRYPRRSTVRPNAALCHPAVAGGGHAGQRAIHLQPPCLVVCRPGMAVHWDVHARISGADLFRQASMAIRAELLRAGRFAGHPAHLPGPVPARTQCAAGGAGPAHAAGIPGLQAQPVLVRGDDAVGGAIRQPPENLRVPVRGADGGNGHGHHHVCR